MLHTWRLPVPWMIKIGLVEGIAKGNAGFMVSLLAWLSRPFRPFFVLKFCRCARYYFMLSVLPFRPSRRFENGVFRFGGRAKVSLTSEYLAFYVVLLLSMVLMVVVKEHKTKNTWYT